LDENKELSEALKSKREALKLLESSSSKVEDDLKKQMLSLQKKLNESGSTVIAAAGRETQLLKQLEQTEKDWMLKCENMNQTHQNIVQKLNHEAELALNALKVETTSASSDMMKKLQNDLTSNHEQNMKELRILLGNEHNLALKQLQNSFETTISNVIISKLLLAS